MKMARLLLLLLVSTLLTVNISQATSLEKVKEQTREIILNKYGAMIREVRNTFDVVAGLKSMTRAEAYKLRFEMLVSRIDQAKSCPVLLSGEGIGYLEGATRVFEAHYGNIESILAELQERNIRVNISQSWASYIYQGSKILQTLNTNKNFGARFIARMYTLLDPNIDYVPTATVTNCTDLLSFFTHKIVQNLINRQHVKNTICVLRCLQSDNINTCRICVGR